MKERIKKLRKELGLTQQEFADALGLKRNSVANYEIGRNIPIAPIIKSICREFNVREEWLRTGHGDMFNDDSDKIAVCVSEILDEPNNPTYKLIVELVNKYRKLDPGSQSVINDLISGLIKEDV